MLTGKIYCMQKRWIHQRSIGISRVSWDQPYININYILFTYILFVHDKGTSYSRISLSFQIFFKITWFVLHIDISWRCYLYLANKMNQNKNDTLSKQFQSLIGKSYNGTKSISLTHLYIIWLDTGTSIKSGGVKQKFGF
jgi:hypothetical protein